MSAWTQHCRSTTMWRSDLGPRTGTMEWQACRWLWSDVPVDSGMSESAQEGCPLQSAFTCHICCTLCALYIFIRKASDAKSGAWSDCNSDCFLCLSASSSTEREHIVQNQLLLQSSTQFVKDLLGRHVRHQKLFVPSGIAADQRQLSQSACKYCPHQLQKVLQMHRASQ
jgi:hypothetical protein